MCHCFNTQSANEKKFDKVVLFFHDIKHQDFIMFSKVLELENLPRAAFHLSLFFICDLLNLTGWLRLALSYNVKVS